ncbi:uncharacterized protein ARMOST_12490 [Armillaria ostoyae]|uniref:Uncharacterized protein n=1 Tax=Armillaria ostoyae TaxID=47428 RepID=A0A284RK44_ARMOS|nr:uncharacterized protein ARMOST_12490 [Armillaria ostoyae]
MLVQTALQYPPRGVTDRLTCSNLRGADRLSVPRSQIMRPRRGEMLEYISRLGLIYQHRMMTSIDAREELKS